VSFRLDEASFVTTHKYLIIGASGFIGRELYAALGPERAVATYRSRAFPGGVRFDPLTMRLSDSILRGPHGFTHAFVLYAMTDIDDCARHPDAAHAVNVTSPKQVIADLVEQGIVPVFASSDAVFDGVTGGYSETAQVHPVLTYGEHKAEMESYVSGLSSPWLIARLAKVVDGRPGSRDMLEGWLDQLDRGERLRCAHDQVFSPIAVADVARAMIDLCRRECAGLFNLCGPRALRRTELLHCLVDAAGRYRALEPNIEVCSLRDFSFAQARPLNTSMLPDKLQDALGWAARDMGEVCERAARLRYSGGDDAADARD